MVRSPHAHARIESIDTEARARRARRARRAHRARPARRRPEADSAQRPSSPHPADIPLVEHATARRCSPRRTIRSRTDKVRHVGEAVAIVIAETVAAAKDGAEHVEVDYEVLPAGHRHGRGRAARRAARVGRAHVERLPRRARSGDREATEAAFARAAHVVQLRDVGAARHRRPDGAARRGRRLRSRDRRLHAARRQRRRGARSKNDLAIMLDVPDDDVRVDHARRRRQLRHARHDLSASSRSSRGRRAASGRPVKWTCERQEAFASDYQGRDLAVEAELALDARRHVPRDARLEHQQRRRAHRTNFSPLRRRASRSCRASTACPPRYFRARAVVSNTAPTRPYRSSGRPEVMFVMERLIDLACARARLRSRRSSGGATCSPQRSCRTPIRSA